MLKDTECYKENVGMKVYLMNFSRKLLLWRCRNNPKSYTLTSALMCGQGS